MPFEPLHVLQVRLLFILQLRFQQTHLFVPLVLLNGVLGLPLRFENLVVQRVQLPAERMHAVALLIQFGRRLVRLDGLLVHQGRATALGRVQFEHVFV